jgi:hypothetical protein
MGKVMPRLQPGVIRRRWKLLLALTLLVVYGAAGGCYAQRLPPAPSPEEAAVLARGPLPYRVVVRPWNAAEAAVHPQNPDAYALGTYRWLESSGAFASVRLGTVGDTAADFAASSIGAYCNTAVIPLFTILSLGLIPTIFTDTDCKGAVLRPLHPRAGGPDSVVVTGKLAGRVIMGWLAVPAGAMPGWTHGEARDHTRGRARARLAVLVERDRLVALAGDGAAR